MRLALTLLRTTVGALFVGHGLQKLAGWFGGDGLKATGESFEQMGLTPGKPHAAAAGAAETAGGALLCAGLLTPLGAAMVTGSMAVAVHKVHGKNGIWVGDGGFEYNLVLAVTAFALAAEGPGALSLDERLGTGKTGIPVALAELAAALAGAAFVVNRQKLEGMVSQDEPQSPSAVTHDGVPVAEPMPA